MFVKITNERGVALVFTLFVVIVLLSLGAIFVLRTVNEHGVVKRTINLTRSFYLADGGGQSGLDGLDTLINTYMMNTVNDTNPSALIVSTQSYVKAGDGLGFLFYYTRNNGVPVLTPSGTQAMYAQTAVIGRGAYTYVILISEKANPSVVSVDSWDFPYSYRIEAVGSQQGMSKRVIFSGDFTVRVQRDNFAKYALFTNKQTMPSGTDVWFTDKTNFAGPLHTNGRYNIALNPSGVFESVVEQKEQTAKFYNLGAPVLLNDDHNGTRDVPAFKSGFNRAVTAISLYSPVQKEDLIDQAEGGQTYNTNGIYLPNNGTAVTGGIYIRGDSSISLTVNASDNAVYTVAQGETTKVITVDQKNNRTSFGNPGSPPVTYQGLPDGIDNVGTIIYAKGNVTGLSGTVQRDTELTISAENDMVITGHLKYSDYTPAAGTPGSKEYVPPNADGTKNLLGLVTWLGNVRIGTSAPKDIHVHATVLAQSGIMQVDNYNDQWAGPRGTATILGGVITNYYGAFGLFNGNTGLPLAGYGRNFVYDERMRWGNAPPYFPTLSTFIAFTNDITDKMVWQEGG